jgi:hypothetical protein
MDFDKLPKGGEEVSIGGYKGVLSRVTKVAGGLEVTVQLNDEDDETPVSGAHGGFNAADVEKWREEAEEEAEDNADEKAKSDAENKEEANKAQAVKPSAVSKPATASKSAANK